MNAYQLGCFQEGLEGHKPFIDVGLGLGGYEAQAQGYAIYLQNQDLAKQLAKQLAEAQDTSESSSSYYDDRPPDPPKPVTFGRVFDQIFRWEALVGALFMGVFASLAALFGLMLLSMTFGDISDSVMWFAMKIVFFATIPITWVHLTSLWKLFLPAHKRSSAVMTEL